MKAIHRTLIVATLLSLSGALPLSINAQTQHEQGASMSSNSQAAVIHRFYEVALNENRLNLLPELVTPNVINHNADGTQQTGIPELEQGIKRVQSMFSGPHFTVDDVVSNGDKAAARWTMTAKNTGPIGGVAPTGKQITQRAIVFYRFEDGKIAEIWLQLDRLGVLQQIGAEIPGMPTPPASTSR
jgi:predicted ester cyclase